MSCRVGSVNVTLPNILAYRGALHIEANWHIGARYTYYGQIDI